ncbi:MAG: NADP-specific glutamate dehydrogenase [Bacilli bacterium]|nr:NADP-specific glutamate dehydrogenase [Bacilli bacterium]
MNKYIEEVLAGLRERYPDQKEFLQAAEEILPSLEGAVEANPEIERQNILERFVEPDRIIKFRVAWTDDSGKVRVNRGYRIQGNNAIGPYKGGIRFHRSVNESVLKFLALEQILKNSLTGLPMGGGKGGSDFDPHGKSDAEVMRFCQAFVQELYRHVGPNCDVPAGDIGVGAREVGYMFGEYKRLTGRYEGVLTGKGLSFGGSLIRTEATGYGLCYFAEKALNVMRNDSFKGKTVVVSGSGNVAIFAAQKVGHLGGKVVAMSDSSGYVYDPEGIDLDLIKDIKLGHRGRIEEYAEKRGSAEFHAGSAGIWSVKCDVALPCAIQNELDGKAAEALIRNGVIGVFEGANMPCTPEAQKLFIEKKVAYSPGKASNAGGVAVSGLEMSQNSLRLSWSAEEVDQRLKGIMENIFANCFATSKELGDEGNLLLGANAYGFKKVAEAMIAQGVY